MTSTATASITIRLAHDGDSQTLFSLAALDSAEPLRHPILIAEIDGRPSAALSLDDGAVVADPFVHTRDVVHARPGIAQPSSRARAPRRRVRSHPGQADQLPHLRIRRRPLAPAELALGPLAEHASRGLTRARERQLGLEIQVQRLVHAAEQEAPPARRTRRRSHRIDGRALSNLAARGGARSKSGPRG